MKTGNTQIAQIRQAIVDAPQWSPVMKTGNTYTPREKNIQNAASMEPGHEDREYFPWSITHDWLYRPQWSPVMKTGNTCSWGCCSPGAACLNGARS
mgnify:CR=1 FL=1